MPALKTELELAVRVTLDLSRETTATERTMLGKALQLAKDVHAIRGTSDPALALIEERLALAAGDPSAPPPTGTERYRSIGKVAENETIVRMLKEGEPPRAVAKRLGMHWRTVYRRMQSMGLQQVWERPR